MKARHIFAIARKEWLHIKRDPMTVFLLVIGPVLMLIIMAYAMATDVKNVPTIILNEDQSPQSEALIRSLDDSSILDVIERVGSINEINDQIESRKAKLAVIIEPGFSAKFSSLEGLQNLGTTGPGFRFIIDGTDPISAETALEAAYVESEGYVIEQANTVLDAELAAGADKELIQLVRAQLESAIRTQIDNRYNPELKAIWDLVPALIAVVLVLPGISIATVIARERDQGTLEALVATPINKHAILLGKALPYVGTAMINVVLMYIVARVVFDIPFRGNLVLYLLLSSLYTFATLAVGLLFSILIKSQEAALWASMLFFLFPGLLLSGAFFPVEVFPFIIKLETLELPVVSGVLINRGMFLQGVGAKELWWNIILLLVIAIEGFEIAGRVFKKRIA